MFGNILNLKYNPFYLETQHDKAEKSSDKRAQHSDQADKHSEFDQQMLELNDALEELSVMGKNTDDYALMALAKLVEKAASLCANATGVAGMAVKAMLALGGGLIKKVPFTFLFLEG